MKKGFTLVELIAVVVVLAIISLVSIPIITGIVNKVRVNALRVSAEGLIDASRLYNAQYQNDNTVRFDIANSKISSEDTDKLLKYKGEIKAGTVIIDSRGRSVICVTDGKRSAYKNYSENIVTVSNNKACNVPAGGSIVYLGNEATVTELSNQELTQQLQVLQQKVDKLENSVVSVGTIISYSTSSVPSGYLKCEGQTVSRTEYKALFEKIGTTYGAGDGSTTFNVPDLRGEFIRGTGTNSHTKQGSGANVGVHQDGTEAPYTLSDSGGAYIGRPSSGQVEVIKPDYMDSANHYVTAIGTSRNSNPLYPTYYTSRPTNTSVLFCIKY